MSAFKFTEVPQSIQAVRKRKMSAADLVTVAIAPPIFG
jgi:hypothetical protein